MGDGTAKSIQTIKDAQHIVIGEVLRDMRLGAKIEAEELARMLGVRVSKVVGLEGGSQRLLLHDFIRICEALEIDPVEATGRLAAAVRKAEGLGIL